jgi:catechol 2,3-dioxygenase-like lactoylglutathione lyase family enzyme
MVKVNRIFETVLYADDLDAAVEFYGGILGMEVTQRSDLFVTFRCESGVLLVFDPDKSGQRGRSVPAHGAHGPGHVAFAVGAEDLDAWRAHFEKHGVEIETEVEWKAGGVSLYIRDPADNSVELAPPTLWGGGWSF